MTPSRITIFRLGVVAGLGMIGACRGKPSAEAGTPAIAQQAARTADSINPPRFEVRDSAGLFDPGGYFSPTEPINVNGQELRYLSVHVADYYYDGALHYDRPRILVPVEVSVATGIDRSDDLHTLACPDPVIRADTVSIHCQRTPLGVLRVEGHFIAASGAYWKRPVPTDSALLVARVVLEQGGVAVHDRVHRFRYFAGE